MKRKWIELGVWVNFNPSGEGFSLTFGSSFIREG